MKRQERIKTKDSLARLFQYSKQDNLNRLSEAFSGDIDAIQEMHRYLKGIVELIDEYAVLEGKASPPDWWVGAYYFLTCMDDFYEEGSKDLYAAFGFQRKKGRPASSTLGYRRQCAAIDLFQRLERGEYYESAIREVMGKYNFSSQSVIAAELAKLKQVIPLSNGKRFIDVLLEAQ